MPSKPPGCGSSCFGRKAAVHVRTKEVRRGALGSTSRPAAQHSLIGYREADRGGVIAELAVGRLEDRAVNLADRVGRGPAL
jgi:hypothetical protein